MQGCCKGCNQCEFRAKEDSDSLTRKEKLHNANELVNKVKFENIDLVLKLRN